MKAERTICINILPCRLDVLVGQIIRMYCDEALVIANSSRWQQSFAARQERLGVSSQISCIRAQGAATGKE